jgi:NAD(P)-dependent dehydrogenase (short-subunit alcohol dehydrogenase family)
MRKQRGDHVVTISSTAGVAGQDFRSAYAASKFGLEGWMESPSRASPAQERLEIAAAVVLVSLIGVTARTVWRCRARR